MLRWLLVWLPVMLDARPQFDRTALLQNVLVPADAAVGGILYRLRASDPTFDYPLAFRLRERSTTVSVENLNCTRFNSVCQANIILLKRLEVERYYDFGVIVQNVRGETSAINCSFRATNATTPIAQIFPGAPSLLTVSEKARRNTELGQITAMGQPANSKPVLLELWGSPQFGLHQKLISEKDAEGTILLLSSLDYETSTIHHLTILANDPWTDRKTDTRNIASWPLLVSVLDEQDTPPIFTLAPPTTSLSPTLAVGDPILRVKAEDGDRGNPRAIRYEIEKDGNPIAKYFGISEENGEIYLARPLTQLQSVVPAQQPVIITVIAEEVRSNPDESPAQSSSVQLALIPPSTRRETLAFAASEYYAIIDENAPPGTPLDIPQAEVITQPGNVVALYLAGDNGTFDILPGVVEGHSHFDIHVRDPKTLDYERWHAVICRIVAREVGAGNRTTSATLKVLLNDVNDNVPRFIQEAYQTDLQENAAVGTTVLRVEAIDVDRGPENDVIYTRLYGVGSEYFEIDKKTGVIKVKDSQGLDAETYPVFNLIVEAVDNNGKGLSATASVTITLLDVNDEVPEFEKIVYEFILNSNRNAFTSPAFVKATDKDVSTPNNKIHYELITSADNLVLDENSGELHINGKWSDGEVKVLRARAWDEGVPRLSHECTIRIYPPDGQSRKMFFVVSGSNPDRETVLETLRALTGGRVVIERIRPYKGYEDGVTYVSNNDNEDRSVVEATVTYSKDSVVNLDRLEEILNGKHRITETRAGKGLLWFLIVFTLLLLLIALLLIICCACKGCPLYVAPKRRKVVTTEAPLISKAESKSVQVAEWFGRREAWTPDREAESLRRHEAERGSDRVPVQKRTIHRQEEIYRDTSHDHLYIREGNADILRLVTRGPEHQPPPQPQHIPVTLVADPAYVADGGKDLLMKRFIEQQQAEAVKSQMLLPNAVSRLQTEHEMFEQSLRQQNVLLRQLLLERERDLRLETQSLPAGTQTDQDAGTQTEPQYLRPPARKIYSDNDASDVSDDEIALIKARAKRRNGSRSQIKKRIRTPILEESEYEVEKNVQSKPSSSIKQTRTSELRQQRAAKEMKNRSTSAIRKDVLKEISASLEQNQTEDKKTRRRSVGSRRKSEDISEDSLDEISPQSEKSNRYFSETDVGIMSATSSKQRSTKSQSYGDLTKIDDAKTKPKTKRVARYMEWYEKNKKPTQPKKNNTELDREKIIKEEVKKMSNGVKKDSASERSTKVKKSNVGPEHPLLQHSEHRFEAQYPNIVRRMDEDVDSGIALTKPDIAQKKSVFTIAYDGMHTSQLRTNSSTPPT